MKTIKNIAAVLLLTTTVLFAKEEKAASTEEAKATYLNVIPGKNDLYKIFYTRKASEPVEVTVKDSFGKTLSTEVVKNKKGFVRKYDFSKLPEGDYKVYVKDEEGLASRSISIKKSEKLAHILPGENHLSFKVLVPETNNAAVNVKVYDKYNNMIKSDIIEEKEGFLKNYTLTKTLMEEYSLEIWMDNKLIAKRFMTK